MSTVNTAYISELLKHRKRTRRDLARALGLSEAGLSHKFTGRRRFSVAEVVKIAQFLEIDLNELVIR